MTKLTFVDEDIRPSDVSPGNLDGCDTHPIFARRVFRVSDAFFRKPLNELDLEDRYSIMMYRRMIPALRLATLFLKKALPQLYRIYTAPEQRRTTADDDTYYVLPYISDPSEGELDEFNNNILGYVGNSHRFTLLSSQDATDTHDMPASHTTAVFHGLDSFPETDFYTQTALSTKWLLFLNTTEWDDMAHEEKYGKLFQLARTLVSELAHAIWLHRLFDNMLMTNEVRPMVSEPDFFPDVAQSGDFGLGIEKLLFGGYPGYLEADDRKFGSGRLYRIPFSLVDETGTIFDIQHISRHSVWRYFDLNSEIWALTRRGGRQGDNTTPVFELELLTDALPEEQVPIVKMPDPRRLKAVYTPFNELVAENDLLRQKRPLLRGTQMRLAAQKAKGGVWWGRPASSPSEY